MGIKVNIRKKLGDFSLDISFASDARRIGILGPSGCGKSMTLKSIAGIEQPDRGYIEVGAVRSAPDRAARNSAGSAAQSIDGSSIAVPDRAARNAAGSAAQSIDGSSFAAPDNPNHRANPAGSNHSPALDNPNHRANLAGSNHSPAPDNPNHRADPAGRVLFDSDRGINLKPQKRNVGYMFQNYALFPTMTVAQNIAAGLSPSPGKANRRDRDDRVREMIRRFHLQGLENHLPGQLSGGQQQRVALARIMAYQPDLILLDEPFSALDQHLKERLQHEMMALLEDYQGQVIMVSHSRDEIYRFSEELVILDQGQVLARGGTRRLFDDPGTMAVAAMTGCKNFTAAVRTDAHTLRLTDWGIDLHLHRDIPEDTTAIGYRAHFFEPVWGTRQDNCIPFCLSGFDELPFERRYYIIPQPDRSSDATDAKAELICWFIQDNERRALDARPAPDYLRLREEAILLLHDPDPGE